MLKLDKVQEDVILEALLYYARDKQHESIQGNEYLDIRFDTINKMKADKAWDLYMKLKLGV